MIGKITLLLTVLILAIALTGCDSYAIPDYFSVPAETDNPTDPTAPTDPTDPVDPTDPEPLTFAVQKTSLLRGETIELYPAGGTKPYSFAVIAGISTTGQPPRESAPSRTGNTRRETRSGRLHSA